MAFTLDPLPYAFDAVEPNIDAQTMEIHHDKHHQGYVNKLNAAIEGTDLADKSIEEICKVAMSKSTGVRNNGGGHFNHSMFWSIINPENKGRLSGELKDKIESQFGSVDEFKKEFSDAAGSRFGSGWAWLCVKADGSLCVCSTPNQDNPLMDNEDPRTPIMGLDVWEHAYYLKYQNKRPDYIQAFWNAVNWNKVEANYAATK
ncbi:MAG: Fe-Mn family superoxide dismutase [Spirosomataceae bacterium]|jgi:Fe-Mn family superoxide dismutase